MIEIIKADGQAEQARIAAMRARAAQVGADIQRAVSAVMADVKARGYEAVKEYSLRFDHKEPYELTQADLAAAYERCPKELIAALERAAANIRDYNERLLVKSQEWTSPDGGIVGRVVRGLSRVGIYVPGGTAAYPSSVLMNCIPAKIAGVDEIVMTTPASGGEVSPAILAAAKVAGVDRVFRVGGAQAVAALAYGTETIPRVDKIVGPGNAFVAEAKRQVFGQVAIDMIAGPSEILIVADKSADPVWLAADMLSQAEHDKLATAILITDSAALAERTAAELEAQLEVLPRKDIAGASVEANGKIIVTDDLSEAVNIANEIAPEHLELCVERPFDWLGRVRNAGSVFLGHYCPEPLGDYLSGTNHTLPTMGTACFSSPLGVDDFIKRSYFSYYTAEGLESVADDVALFADTEGLHAHAVSATIRRRGRSE